MVEDQTTVVITTSSTGLAWYCLAFADLTTDDSAVLTTPGAAVGDGAPGLGDDLVVALALTGARQIRVLGYADDPVYRLGAKGIGREARQAGINLDWAIGSRFLTPGLQHDATTTVRAAVAALARLPWLPGGLTISGTVIDADGAADNVALVLTSADRTPPATPPPAARRVPGVSPPPPPQPLEGTDALVGAPMNSSATLGALMNSSATLGAPMNSSATLGAEILGGGSGTAGSMADVGREAGSPMAVDGEIQSGPVILGGRTDDGPVKLGAMDSAAAGPLITGGVITSTGSLSGGGALSSATEVIPKPAAPLDDSWLDNALQSRDVDDGTDMLGAWIESDRVASLPPIGGDAPWEDGTPGSGRGHERRQRGRPGSLEPPPPPKPSGEVEERIAAAVDILHRFLIRRCKTHSLTRDMRRLHRAGAGPEPIMEELLTLVRQQANDVPEVRAAFGTIEMARTVLTRGQMLDQLQTIIRDEG